MLSLSKVALLLHNAMKSFCENCRSNAYRVVKLQAVKVDELDVCGSLVLSNPVTYVFFIVSKKPYVTDSINSYHINLN